MDASLRESLRTIAASLIQQGSDLDCEPIFTVGQKLLAVVS